MEKTIMFFYDKDNDVMDISMGKPKVAISEEADDDIIVRIDPHSREIIGFTIINFTNVFLKRFATKDKPIELTLSKT
ncbi:MAG: DUF2283 domain-containing protein [Candidatus Bathyarchaeia archaeon]